MNFCIANTVIPNHVFGILLFRVYSTSLLHLLSTYCNSGPVLCTEKTVLNKTMSLHLRKKKMVWRERAALVQKNFQNQNWRVTQHFPFSIFLIWCLLYTWRAAVNLRPKLNQFLFLQCCRAFWVTCIGVLCPILDSHESNSKPIGFSFSKGIFSYSIESIAGMNWSHTTFHVALWKE